jgi:Clp amino terminal domain, pathogenicity island component
VFERFTERARQVVVLAQDEARALKHNYIGTEHLLLGLLREEEGAAAHVLQTFGVTLDEAREQVARVVGRGDEPAVGQIPFTPHAKRVLELSLREALSLGHDYIDTEHVLLGLIREGEGVGSQVLGDFGVDLETVREAVARMFSGRAAPAELLLTDSCQPGWTSFGPRLPGWSGVLTSVPPPEPVASAPEPIQALDSMLLRGILIGWALAAVTLSAGVVAGWLIWG